MDPSSKFNPANYIPSTARVLAEYNAIGAPFELSTRPYYSSGSIVFDLVDPLAADPTKFFAVAPAGREIVLFSYSQGTSVQGVGLGDRNANVADTNMATAAQTNNEDFVIEGISCTSRGVRFINDAAPVTINSPLVKEVYLGLNELTDISSTQLPPEISSPLALEDALWGAVKNNMSVTTKWDQKNTDLLGMASEIPEGGAKSYLRASGAPLTNNIMRIPEGYVWRNSNQTRDRLFNMILRIEQPIVFLLTNDPPSNVPVKQVAVDFLFRLHGTAFYTPSTN